MQTQSIRKGSVTGQIYSYLKRRKNGATAAEVVKATGLPRQSVSGRIRELEIRGLVENNDSTPYRVNKDTSREALVWRAL